MLTFIVKLFKILNTNVKPSQVANSLAIGLILGFMPKNNLLWYILMIFFLFVRTNKVCYAIMIALGSVFAWSLDSIFDAIGYTILTLPALENFFANLLEVPFVAFTKFNNSIVMGSFVLGIVFYIPLFILAVVLLGLWRKVLAPKISNSKIVKSIYKFPLVNKIAGIAANLAADGE